MLSLTPTDSAHAQMCTDPMTDGMSSCSGTGTAASTITITGPAGFDLVVDDPGSFELTVASGSALNISGATGRAMTVDLDGDITATGSNGNAIYATHAGTGAMNITTDGTLMGNANGIYVRNSGTGATNITTTGAVSATTQAIYLSAGSSTITLDIGGNVSATTAISSVRSSAMGQTIIFRDGVTITGGSDFGNTTNEAKTSVEVEGSVTINGRLDSRNSITLARPDDSTPDTPDTSTDDRLSVSNFSTGGTLTLNVNFMDGTADRLIIPDGGMTSGTGSGGSVGTPTTINLVTTGNFDDRLSTADPIILVEVPTGIADGVFVAGTVNGGMAAGGADSFTLTRDETTSNWVVVGTRMPPPPPTGNGDNGGGGMPDPDPVTVVENMCAEQSTSGTFICDGTVADATTLAADAGETLTVTATDDFTGITATTGDALTLTGAAGSTGIDVTLGGTITAGNNSNPGTGITATHMGNGAVSITAGAITASENGIEVSTSTENSAMPTTMSITTNGAIMAGNESDEAGIDASHAGSGDLTITANADVSGTTGISAEVTGDSTADITITIGGEIDGDDGTADNDDTAISMTGGGNHRLVINSGGSIADDDTVTSDAEGTDMNPNAILELSAAAGETDAEFDLGDLENFHDGDDTTPAKAFTVFEKTGTGTWTLTGDQTMDSSNMPMDRAFASASVMAGTLQLNGATLELDGDDAALEVASGATLEVMGDSASTIMGGVNNSGTMQVNADLTLSTMDMHDTLTNSGTLNITGATTISAVLSSSGTVEIAGTEAAPTTATIMGNLSNSGTLNLDTATLNLGSDNTLTNSGTMNIMGTSTVGTGFRSPGTVLLDAATLTLGTTAMPGTLTIASGGTLNIMGDTTINGILNTSAGTATATLGVNLTDPDAFTSERLTVSESGSTGSVAIALNVTSTTDQELAAADLSGVTLVSGAGTGASALTFSAANEGNCTIIGNNGDCMFTIDSNGALTSLTVTLAASDILYENYAASLAELSRVSGMRARFGNRIWATEEGRGIWARAEASNSELGPNTPSETSAAYEIRDTRLRFGVDAPIRAVPGLILGGNVWLARADTDITAADEDDGKIETEGYALAATAHWQASTGFYVDGQAQFAAFTSDLSSAGETRVDGNDGRGITLAAEVGYPVPVREFTITPQAQLSWSDVDFDDFTASDNDARISLGDGETVDARIGVSVDRRWSERSGTLGHVWGALDLRAPLDGETSAKVDENALISEREEPALGLGMGVSFLLRDNTSIAAELATTQGDEIEEYKGSLALRFTF